MRTARKNKKPYHIVSVISAMVIYKIYKFLTTLYTHTEFIDTFMPDFIHHTKL
jgi:hypothetical protein